MVQMRLLYAGGIARIETRRPVEHREQSLDDSHIRCSSRKPSDGEGFLGSGRTMDGAHRRPDERLQKVVRKPRYWVTDCCEEACCGFVGDAFPVYSDELLILGVIT